MIALRDIFPTKQTNQLSNQTTKQPANNKPTKKNQQTNQKTTKQPTKQNLQTSLPTSKQNKQQSNKKHVDNQHSHIRAHTTGNSSAVSREMVSVGCSTSYSLVWQPVAEGPRYQAYTASTSTRAAGYSGSRYRWKPAPANAQGKCHVAKP